MKLLLSLSEAPAAMPLDIPSSSHRPRIQSAVPITIVSQDPLVESALRTRLAKAHDTWLVPEPSAASVVLWDPPADLADDELPELPIESNPLGQEPSVIALVDEDRDPMPLLAAGVRGLINRDVDGERLRAAILAVSLGLTILDDDPADGVVAAWSPPASPPPEPAPNRLTPREREVLEQLADGLSNRAIGEVLGISAHTVKFHVDALLDKLSARSRTQAVVKAMREGLLELA